MTDLVLTYLPCTLDKSSLRNCHSPKQNAHLVFNTKQKNIKIEYIYIYLKKYLIQIKGKRQMSQQNLRSWILSSAYHMGLHSNQIEFGLVFGRSLKL
jgi:hypothetical protein